MAPARRFPTTQATHYRRLHLRNICGQTDQQRRRPQHALVRHRANKIVCARLSRIAPALRRRQTPHQCIHMVGREGASHKKIRQDRRKHGARRRIRNAHRRQTRGRRGLRGLCPLDVALQSEPVTTTTNATTTMRHSTTPTTSHVRASHKQLEQQQLQQ